MNYQQLDQQQSPRVLGLRDNFPPTPTDGQVTLYLFSHIYEYILFVEVLMSCVATVTAGSSCEAVSTNNHDIYRNMLCFKIYILR